jgi:putative oxidoreductase
MTNGAAWGVLVLRIVLGVVFVMHGYLAYAVLGPRGAEGYLARMGFPAHTLLPLAWYLIVVHLVGGALIIVGLWTRVAALLNIPIMASAVALLHWPQGFFIGAVVVDTAARKAMPIGYEFTLLVLACAVAIALIGAGPFSIDRVRTAPGRRR